LSKVASYPAYQNLILRKNFTVPFLKYKLLKLKLKVFLAGHSVAMVTYSWFSRDVRKNKMKNFRFLPLSGKSYF